MNARPGSGERSGSGEGAGVRVLVIDDSALVRQMLTEILSSDPEIEVVGTAADPYVAREMIKRLRPEVLTLDVEMPRMDGLTFLRNLMRLHPLPVVMVSSLTRRGADVTLEALEIGAVDFVSKPAGDVGRSLGDYADEIVEKVKTASRARLRERPPCAGPGPPRPSAGAVPGRSPRAHHSATTDRIIAVGASTGGTEALKVLLEGMSPDASGMVIAQHIPAAFSRPFAMRMDAGSPMTVSEAEDGQRILPGHAYVAPGDRHLLVVRDGAGYRCRLSDGPPVNRHRPSVDVLFRSAAESAGQNAVGVILTGMGDDGARGLARMREAGAFTVAQDERTSVVWGMPGEAVRLGAAREVAPLEAISALVARVAEPNPEPRSLKFRRQSAEND